LVDLLLNLNELILVEKKQQSFSFIVLLFGGKPFWKLSTLSTHYTVKLNFNVFDGEIEEKQPIKSFFTDNESGPKI
jgi:hypothetical protein